MTPGQWWAEAGHPVSREPDFLLIAHCNQIIKCRNNSAVSPHPCFCSGALSIPWCGFEFWPDGRDFRSLGVMDLMSPLGPKSIGGLFLCLGSRSPHL